MVFMSSAAKETVARKRLESVTTCRAHTPWKPGADAGSHVNPWPLSERKAKVMQLVHDLADEHHDVTVWDILSKSRRRVLSDIREVIGFAVFELCPELSGPEIAEWLQIPRTTLIAAQERMAAKLEADRQEAFCPGPHQQTPSTEPSVEAA